MRKIDYIAIHCTATSQDATIESIRKFWKDVKGWSSPGYHYIIKPDGEVKELLSIDKVSNGVQGFNSQTINIAYIGGVNEDLNPIDNRTPEQRESMLKLIKTLKNDFPAAKIQGHRDFPNVKKDCPSFDVKKWLYHEGIC